MNFIEITDAWGDFTVLNPNYIIRIKAFEYHEPDHNLDMTAVQSVIEYGSGFLDVIYMNIKVKDVWGIIRNGLG